MSKAVVKDFRGTNLIFIRGNDVDTIDITWQVFFNDVEFNYNIGKLQSRDKLLDKQIELYATEFMYSVMFHKAMVDVITKLKESNDRMERDYMTNFYESYSKDLGEILIKISTNL